MFENHQHHHHCHYRSHHRHHHTHFEIRVLSMSKWMVLTAPGKIKHHTGSPCISVFSWGSVFNSPYFLTFFIHSGNIFLCCLCPLVPGIMKSATDLIQNMTRCTWSDYQAPWNCDGLNAKIFTMPRFQSGDVVKPRVFRLILWCHSSSGSWCGHCGRAAPGPCVWFLPFSVLLNGHSPCTSSHIPGQRGSAVHPNSYILLVYVKVNQGRCQ